MSFQGVTWQARQLAAQGLLGAVGWGMGRAGTGQRFILGGRCKHEMRSVVQAQHSMAGGPQAGRQAELTRLLLVRLLAAVEVLPRVLLGPDEEEVEEPASLAMRAFSACWLFGVGAEGRFGVSQHAVVPRARGAWDPFGRYPACPECQFRHSPRVLGAGWTPPPLIDAPGGGG